MSASVQKYLKAFFAAALAGLGAAGTAYAQGNGHISGQACIFIATTVVGSLATVWAVPNLAPTTTPTK